MAGTVSEQDVVATKIDVGKNRLRAGIWLVTYIAACAVFIALRDRSLMASILATFAVVGAAIKLHQASLEDLVAGKWRWLGITALPLVGGAIGFVAWRASADGWGFFGLALLYLGFGRFVEELRDAKNFPEDNGPWILAGLAGLAVLGMVAMAATGSKYGTYVAVAGVLTVPIGVSLVSAKWNRALKARHGPPAWQLAIAGLVCLGIVVAVMLRGFDVSAPFVGLFVGALVILLLAMAARSNADVIIVIAMTAVIWTLMQHSVPIPEALQPGPHSTVFAAVGDSYISGEGADAFFAGTNEKTGNHCRQAPTAYAPLLTGDKSSDIPGKLVFLACSGAKILGVEDQLAQFDRLRSDQDLNVKFVLLSVGGNDALFGSVGKTCIMAGNCSDLGKAWIANLHRLVPRLEKTYRLARLDAGKAAVVVVPYPVPLAKKHCDASAFSGREERFLYDFTVELNRVVQRAARKARVGFVAPVADVLRGHRICDGPIAQSGVNFLATNTVLGSLEQSVNPVNWFHNSMHPNARGHERMRVAISKWIGSRAFGERAEAPGASTMRTETLGNQCTGKFQTDLTQCADTWSTKQNGRFLLTKGLLVLLAGFGGWLLALAMLRAWRLAYDD